MSFLTLQFDDFRGFLHCAPGQAGVLAEVRRSDGQYKKRQRVHVGRPGHLQRLEAAAAAVARVHMPNWNEKSNAGGYKNGNGNSSGRKFVFSARATFRSNSRAPSLPRRIHMLTDLGDDSTTQESVTLLPTLVATI